MIMIFLEVLFEKLLLTVQSQSNNRHPTPILLYIDQKCLSLNSTQN